MNKELLALLSRETLEDLVCAQFNRIDELDTKSLQKTISEMKRDGLLSQDFELNKDNEWVELSIDNKIIEDNSEKDVYYYLIKCLDSIGIINQCDASSFEFKRNWVQGNNTEWQFKFVSTHHS
jgi:hypothetical protein